MKKTLCLLLAALIATGVFGAISENEPVRITFWHSAIGDAGEIIEKLVNEFNTGIGSESGIYVEAIYQGSYSDSVSKMNSILSSENYADLPDVMQLDATGKLRFSKSPLSYTAEQALYDHPESDISDFFAPALENWRLGGTLLGIPFATSTTLTYYNASVLDEAPETLYDVMDIPDIYDVPDGVSVYACVPNTPTLANWIGQMGGYVVDNKNGSEDTATYLSCADDGTLLSFLEIWKELYESGALINRASSTDEFIAGRQLIMTASSSMISTLYERIGDGFEMGVSPYLKVSADSLAGATVSGSCLVMFNHDGERAEAAWRFVEYMTSAENQALFAAGTGYLPSRRNAVETEIWQALISENPAYNVGFIQLSETPADMRSVTVGPAADFYYTIQDIIAEMLDDDLSPEETLNELSRELNGLLSQYLRANG